MWRKSVRRMSSTMRRHGISVNKTVARTGTMWVGIPRSTIKDPAARPVSAELRLNSLIRPVPTPYHIGMRMDTRKQMQNQSPTLPVVDKAADKSQLLRGGSQSLTMRPVEVHINKPNGRSEMPYRGVCSKGSVRAQQSGL